MVAKAAGLTAGSPLTAVLNLRSEILELTENSHEASLRPNQPGGLKRSERAGLACRIAKRNNDPVLAKHYESMFGVGSQAIADTGFDGGDDARLKAIIRHTDLVTLNPKEATASDITELLSAGLDDADIVRLSELIAFISYQVRVIAGLRLMAEVA
ncbi:MAG: hypothetical protein IH872_00125 [Chloroflexi bacterium]|nr:hypothetical protein [Chloroflexota bacterium]